MNQAINMLLVMQIAELHIHILITNVWIKVHAVHIQHECMIYEGLIRFVKSTKRHIPATHLILHDVLVIGAICSLFTRNYVNYIN